LYKDPSVRGGLREVRTRSQIFQASLGGGDFASVSLEA
jgi:hypothetical protein